MKTDRGSGSLTNRTGESVPDFTPDQANRMRRLPLESVFPDPGRVRWDIPADLRASLAQGSLSPWQALDVLQARCATQPRLTDTLRDLEMLAADIGANGLVVPLTVVETQAGQGLTQYTIESGVRRWWAHWMLVRQGKDEFRYVLCRLAPAQSCAARWLGENLHRRQLSAVETGLALARLILENQAGEAGPTAPEALVPQPIRDLARRIRAGDPWPTAANWLGYGAVRWKPYLVLLSLSDEMLELAHEYRLPADLLEQIAQMEEPAQQRRALDKLTGQADEPEAASDPRVAHGN